ncbi:MAG: hypothetical protein KAU03_03720, partial [Candidatus Altiarchaeales archaeon]|nr:hypothetical protein [Candidatus Altiarchaeales archaeon]
HCPPCEVNRSCFNDSDCLSGWCYMGVCRVSTCMDGICGPGEEKMDCGGPCRDCPWIKVEEECFIGENLTVTLINPWTGLTLVITDPSGESVEYNITHTGLGTYRLLHYTPELVGPHILELVDYDKVYVDVRRKPLIPLLEEVLEKIPEEVRSLLIPLILLISFTYWFCFVRRTKVVVDESTIRRFMTEDLLHWGLLEKHKKLYTAVEMEGELPKVKNLVFIELSESELDKAEDLSDVYGISLDEAKSLVLCKKLRARKFITETEFPHEIRYKFMGTKMVNLEDELRLMGL